MNLEGGEKLLKTLIKCAKNMRIRGKVNTLKYSNYEKRYLNEELKCDRCLKTIGLHESDHLLRNCTGISCTPINEYNKNYPVSLAKRMRYIYPDHFK